MKQARIFFSYCSVRKYFLSFVLLSNNSLVLLQQRKYVSINHQIIKAMKNHKRFIKDYQLSSSQSNHLVGPTQKTNHFHSPNHQIISTTNSYTTPRYQSLRNHPIINNNRKISLPPIIEYRKINSFDLQTKKNDVIYKCFKAKNHEYSISKCRSERSHTVKLKTYKQKGTNRSAITINLQQIRMKPVDKYFYKLDNIRLAERLLITKPSPQLQRANHSKFYQQQNHYKCQISKNYLTPRKNKIKQRKKQKKVWAQ